MPNFLSVKQFNEIKIFIYNSKKNDRWRFKNIIKESEIMKPLQLNLLLYDKN